MDVLIQGYQNPTSKGTKTTTKHGLLTVLAGQVAGVGAVQGRQHGCYSSSHSGRPSVSLNNCHIRHCHCHIRHCHCALVASRVANYPN